MKNKRTCDYIAEAIQNEILSGRMEAGEPLRQEELAETLGYSRIPIREALQILENQGLVRRLETRHVVVADFSEKVMDEIFELICRVQQRAILDMAEDETEWEMAVEEEEDFHTFIYTCISNEFFRKLLETAADCFIRYAVNETEDGKNAAKRKKRIQKLETVRKAYGKGDTGKVEQELEAYYGLLTESVRRERGFQS